MSEKLYFATLFQISCWTITLSGNSSGMSAAFTRKPFEQRAMVSSRAEKAEN